MLSLYIVDLLMPETNLNLLKVHRGEKVLNVIELDAL